MCGARATLIRDVPYTMLELGLYENFKTLLKKYHKREDLSNMVRPLSNTSLPEARDMVHPYILHVTPPPHPVVQDGASSGDTAFLS